MGSELEDGPGGCGGRDAAADYDDICRGGDGIGYIDEVWEWRIVEPVGGCWIGDR